MPAAAYMMSILARQRQLLGEGFAVTYPNAWLVWEPGPWRPVERVSRDIRATSGPGLDLPARPPGEDAICFQLLDVFHLPLKVGRATGNDIVINDATVSREQLVLDRVDEQWGVRAVREGVTLNDQPLAPGQRQVLHTLDRLAAGEVTLTYYECAPFLERLGQAQPHLATPIPRRAS